MIYCPNCGTANRDGSRFCNDCGHKLPSKTGIVCPMCSHMNPPANVYCDKCQARLVPAGPASPASASSAAPAPVKKGLSLPTKPAPSQGAGQALSGVEGPAPERSEGEAEPSPVEPEAPPGAGPEAEPEETPDWLHRLRAATPKAPERAGELPDSAAQEAPEPAPGGDIPEWMRPASGEQLDWFDRLAEGPLPSRDTSAPDEALSRPEAWIQETGSGQAVQQEAESPIPWDGADLPEWLSELTSPPSLSGVEGSASELPQRSAMPWQEEIQPDLPSPRPEGVEGEPVDAEGIPDWLAALGEAERPLPDRAGAADEAPDWLASMNFQTGPGAEQGEAPAENWRGWALPGEPPSMTPEERALRLAGEDASAAGEAELPAWMMGISAGEAERDFTPDLGAPLDIAGESGRPGDLGAELAPQPPTGGVPTGPSEMEEASASAAEPPGRRAVGAFAGGEVDEADLAIQPDWLAQVHAQPEAEWPARGTEDIAPAELPDWLRAMGPAPVPDRGIRGPAPVPSEEMPFGEPPPMPARSAPEWLQDVQQAAQTPGAPPPAFADEQGRALGPDIEHADAAAGAELEAASIPLWLEALRPAAAITGMSEDAPAVAETEGLLAGLPNVLPAMPFMGQPQGSLAARHVETPSADIARAELFQGLLSAGALAPTTAKPDTAGNRARARVRIVRWVTALALLAAAFAPNLDAFMARLGIFRLGVVDTALYAGAAAQIDSLGPEQSVLVSFDYDASQAGEMDPIAEAFLTHIRQRGAQAIAVSLNPNGLALGARVVRSLKEKDIPDAASVPSKPFHPGQAVGAQSAILSEPTDLIVVLAGSPEVMRWWIEQASVSGVEAPIVAGASASALPQIQPYLQSNQVAAVVQGMMGGLAYQRSLDPGQDAGDAGLDRLVRSEALYLSQIAFAGILVTGLLVSLVAGRGGRPEDR